VDKEREGAPGYVGGGGVGGGQVKCRWCWFVTLLIDKGPPLGEGRAPGVFGDFSSS
jgi:hypothetical protein